MSIRSCFLMILYCLLITRAFCFSPQKIIEDWQLCQLKNNMNHQCSHIANQALQLKVMIESLEYQPQGFGLDIMKLQCQLVSPNLLPAQRHKLQEELEMRLAIVGWLESPK